MRRLATALVLGGLAAWLTVQAPRPVPATAPASAFSSGRAMADIRVIGAAPHAVGSARNRQVRDYLLSRMRALGLQARVQRDDAFTLRGDAAGQVVFGGAVENLIGVLPGRDPAAPALALMAHYDSAPGSPGAGDDGAGVASALETVRALKSRGVPARDVILLFTDGEEQGGLGGQAFFRRDPLAAHVGLVINLEARGGSGPAIMFETSEGNGALVAAFAKASVRPFAGSLANLVYQHAPNGTDLTAAKAAGKPGLNFAFVGGQFDYHSPTATAANLSQGSVQSMGRQLLAAATRFAFAPSLPARAPDVVFSQLFGPLLLAYPPWAGWLPIAAALALIALAAVRARRRAPLKTLDVGAGALAGVTILAGSAGLLWLGRLATGVGFGWLQQRSLLARAGLWELTLGLLALAAVAGAAAGLQRRASWLGLLATGAVAAVGLQLWQPLVAYVVAWPLLLAAGTAALFGLDDGEGRLGRWARMAGAALAIGWLGGLAHFIAIGLDAPWVLAPFSWLAALGLWPLLAPLRGRAGALAAGLLLAAAAALIGVIRLGQPWSARFPQATIADYVVDQDSGRAWRVAPAAGFNAWARRALAADGGAVQRRPLPPLYSQAYVAAAAPVAHPDFAVALSQQADCTVTLSAPWIESARALSLALRSDAPATAASIGGRPARLFAGAGTWTLLDWRRMDAGVRASFRPAAAGAVRLRYALRLDRWPAAARPLPPRGPAAMAFGDTDTLVLMGSAALQARTCP